MENNKLKLSIKTLQNIFSDTNEPEWYLNTRKLALYKSYTLPFPKLESMNLEKWNLFNVDFNRLRIEESDISTEEIFEKYNINKDDFSYFFENLDEIKKYNEKYTDYLIENCNLMNKLINFIEKI